MADHPRVVVAVKVVPLHVEIEPLSGRVSLDPKTLGVSPSDRAALAVGRAIAAEISAELDVFSVTPPGGEAALHELAASGIGRFVRIALSDDGDLELGHWLNAYPSSLVAKVLADQMADARFVVTGEHSLDRGSATVPARIAQRLGYAQALGLVHVDPVARKARRRLDGGWTEEISFPERTVLSVEAGTGRTPRAALAALRTAEVGTIRVSDLISRDVESFAPYRVPVDVVAPPRESVASRRAMEVIGALAPTRGREVITATAHEAAATILERLSEWGYR